MDECSFSNKKIAYIIRNGGVVIFPTDTAYGIGCLMENSKAVKKVYEIRKRSHEKAVPVLFSSIRMIKKYVKPFDSNIINLMKKHWPGGLTIILPVKTSKVPSLVRAGKKTIGVRIPNHKPLLKLIRSTGPIIAPSANFAGDLTPFTFSELDKKLISKVDLVVRGKTSLKKSSTVIDCSIKPYKIIRIGAVEI